MTRLTKFAHESIAKRAVDFAFNPKEQALYAAEDALAREAHAMVFKKADLDAVKRLPPNWVRLDNCLRFNVGGQRIYLRTVDEGLPVPYKIGDRAGYSCKELGTIEAGDLCDRIQAHAQVVEQTKIDRRSAYVKTLALVGSASTIKRLREIWPEGRDFYAHYDAVSNVTLPAVPASEVNDILGLAA